MRHNKKHKQWGNAMNIHQEAAITKAVAMVAAEARNIRSLKPVGYVELYGENGVQTDEGTTHNSLADLADQVFEDDNGTFIASSDILGVRAIFCDGTERTLTTAEALARCNKDRNEREGDEAEEDVRYDEERRATSHPSSIA
jgi:hypothetical protein